MSNNISTKLIDGKKIAAEIKNEIAAEVRQMAAEGKRCPHMKPRPPKPPERVAWELKELDKACELPEKEWREWEKKHPGYGRPWYYPDGY